MSNVMELNWEPIVFVMKERQRAYARRESMSDTRKAFETYLFAAPRRMEDE